MQIKNLTTSEVVRDPENFIAEASVDAREGLVVMVYGRYRGMKHSDDGSILFVKSEDGGKTWDTGNASVALEQFDSWGFTSPGVKILPDASILVVAHANGRAGDRVGRASRFRGAFTARSTDGGRSWSRPEPLVAWPLRHMNIWDNPEEAEDGSLIMAVSGTVQSAIPHGSPAESSRSALLRSLDGGEHWYCHGTIAFDPAGIHTFYEPAIVRMRSGRIVSLSRQHYELFGGSTPGGFLFSSYSDDGGASWSPYQRTEIWGYPADLIELSDGRVLCAYGHRKDPAGIRVALSADGVSWSKDHVWEIHRPPALTESSDEAEGRLDTGYRHIGYPSALQLSDGTVLVVYHSFNAEQRKQIILLSSFTPA